MSDSDSTLPPKSNLPADAPWWARWMVENARDAWRWASVRFGVFVAFAAEMYALDPAGMTSTVQEIVPAVVWPHLIAAGALLSIFLRVANLKGNKP